MLVQFQSYRHPIDHRHVTRNRDIRLIAIIAYLLFSACASLPSPSSLHDLHTPQTPEVDDTLLTIVAIDIGQGDSTLIITPSGESILIDAGPEMTGASAIFSTLDMFEIETLSWIFLSHYDADHIGGIPALLAGPDTRINTPDDTWPSDGFVDRGEDDIPETSTYMRYAALAADQRRTLHAGETIILSDNLEIHCLIANGDLADETSDDGEDSDETSTLSENARSLGLLIRYGNFTYWTGGDLPGDRDEESENTITPNLEARVAPRIGDISLLHLHHHGSASSTSEGFLDALTPKAALISAGDQNDYGHPVLSVVNRLIARDIDVYATHTYDDAIFKTLSDMRIIRGSIFISAQASGEFEIDGKLY